MLELILLRYPDVRLHQKAHKVEVIDKSIHELVDAMSEIMYANDGIGLAATQVNVLKRLFMIDLSRNDEPRNLLVFINPEILKRGGEVIGEEGCLSVPGVFEKVLRSEFITMKYQDLSGKEHIQDFSGLMAVCMQHELDHLDGKVFVDYLSSLKQHYIKKRLKKIYKPV